MACKPSPSSWLSVHCWRPRPLSSCACPANPIPPNSSPPASNWPDSTRTNEKRRGDCGVFRFQGLEGEGLAGNLELIDSLIDQCNLLRAVVLYGTRVQ